MAVKIIIDSASDINEVEAESMGITMLPMTVIFGIDEYKDGVDILPVQFYEKLVESDELPKTSQVSEYDFDEEFKKVVDNGDEAVVICLSSKLSGTFGSAERAAKNYPEKIFVVDSLSAAVGERLLCRLAMRLIKKGLTAKEIKEELDEKKQKLCVMGVLETLEYLKKGGRISAAVAFVGGVLSIKPVVKIVNGEVKMVGKAMGSKRGNNLLNTMVQSGSGINFNLPFGVTWSGFDDTVCKKYVSDSSHLWKEYVDSIPSYPLGGTIGTHVGPGVVAVAYFEN